MSLTAQWEKVPVITVHIMEETSTDPVNHDSSWRTTDCTFALAEEMSMDALRTAAIDFIQPEATYGTGGPNVKESAELNSYLYVMVGGQSTTLETEDKLKAHADGDKVLLNNTTTLTSNDLYLVVIFGHDLTITKTVDGAMGDKTKAFTFQLTVQDAASTDNFAVTIKQGSAVVSTSTIYPAGDAGTANTTFALKDGQTAVIEQLPHGKNVTITETDADTYTTSFDGTVEATHSTTVLIDEDKTVAVTNTLGEVAPTGVNPMTKAFWLILLAGAAIAGSTAHHADPDRLAAGIRAAIQKTHDRCDARIKGALYKRRKCL